MDNTNNANLTDLISIGNEFIGCVKHDPTSIINLTARTTDTALTFCQRIPFIKLQKYLKGAKAAEDDPGAACKLSDQLFSDPDKSVDNALRMIKYVTDTDTEKKLDYLVNATRALLLGFISVPEMIRIYQAINDTMPEDLEYLSEIIVKGETHKGNIQIQALERSGLMILSEVNPNVDIEYQEHAISRLGFMVDEYAISFNDDGRQRWYKDHMQKRDRNLSLPFEDLTEEDVRDIVNKANNDVMKKDNEKTKITYDKENEMISIGGNVNNQE